MVRKRNIKLLPPSHNTLSSLCDTVQLCWSMEIKKVRWVPQGNKLFLNTVAGPVGWAARISDIWVLLLFFPSFFHCICNFRIVPFTLTPYLASALWVLLFSGRTKGHSSAKVVGMEWFRYTPEAFRNRLRRSAFFHLANAYGDIYILHFYFSAQTARSFWTFGQEPGSWREALDRAVRHPTEHTAGASPWAGVLSLTCLPWWKENEASEVPDWK